MADLSQGEGAARSTSSARQSITSSLVLQILLYYNCLASAIYVIIQSVLTYHRVSTYRFNRALSSSLQVFCLILFALGEVCRLYFAFDGNLRESVPPLAASLLTGFFPVLPCLVYLTALTELPLPFDAIGGCILLSFLFVEAPFQILALKSQAQAKTAQFYTLITKEHEN